MPKFVPSPRQAHDYFIRISEQEALQSLGVNKPVFDELCYGGELGEVTLTPKGTYVTKQAVREYLERQSAH